MKETNPFAALFFSLSPSLSWKKWKKQKAKAHSLAGAAYLSQVSHHSQVGSALLRASVRNNNLGAYLPELIHDVAAKKPRRPKHSCGYSARLQKREIKKGF